MEEVQMKDIILGQTIGQGACSCVSIATNPVTRDVYAVKIFNTCDSAQASQLHNEVSVLVGLQCDTLVAFKGTFYEDGQAGIIMEYMDKGSIEWIMRKDVILPEPVLASICYQVIWGLGYLHFENQIHRDIKPANILINTFGQIKLTDFGISKQLDNSMVFVDSWVGTYKFMSPERLEGEQYNASSDIWSLGVTMLQLWLKEYPFQLLSGAENNPICLMNFITSSRLSTILNNITCSPSMRQIIASMLEINPKMRPTAAELLSNYKWFLVYGIKSLENAQVLVANWLAQLEPKRKPKFVRKFHQRCETAAYGICNEDEDYKVFAEIQEQLQQKHDAQASSRMISGSSSYISPSHSDEDVTVPASSQQATTEKAKAAADEIHDVDEMTDEYSMNGFELVADDAISASSTVVQQLDKTLCKKRDASATIRGAALDSIKLPPSMYSPRNNNIPAADVNQKHNSVGCNTIAAAAIDKILDYIGIPPVLKSHTTKTTEHRPLQAEKHEKRSPEGKENTPLVATISTVNTLRKENTSSPPLMSSTISTVSSTTGAVMKLPPMLHINKLQQQSEPSTTQHEMTKKAATIPQVRAPSGCGSGVPPLRHISDNTNSSSNSKAVATALERSGWNFSLPHRSVSDKLASSSLEKDGETIEAHQAPPRRRSTLHTTRKISPTTGIAAIRNRRKSVG